MRIVFLHTVMGVTEMFADLIRRHLPPATEVLHIVDETMIAAVRAAVGPTREVAQRLREHALAAAASGAGAMQITCSTISPCVEEIAPLPIPVFTIDAPMAKQAVRRYGKIGVLATNAATLVPSVETIRSAARRAKRTVRVTSRQCDAAYEAFLRGDRATHDKIVIDETTRLARGVDAIILAQASMARLAGELSSLPVPILTSPVLAMKHLARFIARAEAGR